MSLDPAFQGELWLLGWRESHSGGATVTFQLSDPSELDAFRRMTVSKGKVAGQRLACVLVEIQDDETAARPTPIHYDKVRGILADEQHEPNELARKMHVDGYFRNPHLWDRVEELALYTQQEHKAWIMAQPCHLTIVHKGRHGPCAGEIVLHHCKSAATPAAGTGAENPQKPPNWYGVPLCGIGHHQNWAHASLGATREDKQMLLECAIHLTAQRMKEKMKEYLGIESLREITPAMLSEFEKMIEL